MRQHLTLLICAFLLVVITSTNVVAQGMRMSAEDRAKVLKDSLRLSDKQMEQVVAILKEMGSERQALADSIRDRDARREAMMSLMAKSDEKIESLLTKEQKEKYEVMKKEREARFRQRTN
jgi:Spy/CpxP family protein refolding chaperone